VSTETSTNPLLTEGRGVVIRDTQGIGEPVLGRIVEISAEYALVDVRAANGQPVRFELSTLCAMLPGDHDRWKLAAPDGPGSEEYGDLLIRQGGLLAERDRIDRQLDLIGAVLATADAQETNR
jgi:hypothetical protein